MTTNTEQGWLEKNTREILAIFWSLVSAGCMIYILVEFGAHTEILTLIIGLISGSILQSVFGTYFSSSLRKTNQPSSSVGPVAGDVTVNTPQDDIKTGS